MILFIAVVILGVLMVGAAVFAIFNNNLPSAVMAAGAVSLLASILYLILAAPDVAMTEAAIGSGLTTVIFFYILSRIKGKDHD